MKDSLGITTFKSNWIAGKANITRRHSQNSWWRTSDSRSFVGAPQPGRGRCVSAIPAESSVDARLDEGLAGVYKATAPEATDLCPHDIACSNRDHGS